MKKFTYFILLILITSYAYCYQNEIIETKVDCEIISLNAVDILSEYFSNNQYDSTESIITEWVQQCGESEFTKRILILKKILNNESSIDFIKSYFQNNFHIKLKSRINNSRANNFGYRYSSWKEGFNYVPLRHRIDSIIIQKSLKLLETESLSQDEKLICTLFSGNVEEFDNLIYEDEYEESFISNFIIDEIIEYHKERLAFTYYAGLINPIGTNKIFNNSMLIGLTLCSPLAYKLNIELGVKVRYNNSDKDFQYSAKGDTILVNSNYTIFFGAFVGYKIFDNKEFIILPKIGIGLESVNAKPLQKKNYDEPDTYEINTLHLSLGLSVIKKIFTYRYIGIQFNYHYCPYQFNKNLLTSFNNNLFSCEIFLR